MKPMHFVVLLLLLSSCTSEPALPTPLLPAATPSQQTMLPTTTASTNAAIDVITFGEQEFYRDIYQPVIDSFNSQHPTIRVQFVPIDEAFKTGSYEQVYPRVLQMVDTATAEGLSPATLNQLHHQGVVRDLRPFIDADTQFDQKDFYPGTLEDVSIGQSIYAVPFKQTVPLIFYNKTLFAQHGLAPLPPLLDWSTLRTTARAIASSDTSSTATYGAVDLYNQNPWLRELEAQGYQLEGTTALDLTSDTSLHALEQAAALVREHAIYLIAAPPNDAKDAEQAMGLIAQGRVGLWGSVPPLSDIAIGMSIDTSSGPRSGYQKGYVISQGTQHAEAAWRWIAFLSAHSPPDPQSQTSAQLPSRKSVAEQQGYWKSLDPETSAVMQAFLAQPVVPRALTFHPLVVNRELLVQAVRDVASGKQSARQAAAAAKSSLEQRAAAPPRPVATVAPFVVAPAPPLPGTAPATTISFGNAALPDGVLQTLIQTFNRAHPTMTINVVSLRNAKGSRLADAAKNTDCFASFRMPTADDAVALRDLQPLLASSPLQSDYAPAALAPFQYNGRLLGLPLSLNLPTFHANPTLFSSTGQALPMTIASLDELLALAQAHTASGSSYGFALLGDQPSGMMQLLRLANVTPFQYGPNGQWTPTFTDPAVIASLERIVTLLRSTSPHRSLGDYRQNGPRQDADALVDAGEVAVWFDARGSISATDNQRLTGTLLPRAISPLDRIEPSAGVYVSANTPYSEACWTWLQFVSEQAPAYGFPGRSSVATSPQFTQTAPPGATEVYVAARSLLSQVPTQSQAALDDQIDQFWFWQAIDHAMSGKDLRSELQAAQTTTSAYLACVQAGSSAANCARQVDPEYAGLNSP